MGFGAGLVAAGSGAQSRCTWRQDPLAPQPFTAPFGKHQLRLLIRGAGPASFPLRAGTRSDVRAEVCLRLTLNLAHAREHGGRRTRDCGIREVGGAACRRRGLFWWQLGGRFPCDPGIGTERSPSIEVCRTAARVSPRPVRRPSLCLSIGAWTIFLEAVVPNPFPCDEDDL